MNEVIVLIGCLLAIAWIAWIVVKKIVYGLFYAATKAIDNAKRKDHE